MTIRTIGVPMDLGADRRGVDMGPSAIRYAGLSTALDDIGRPSREAGDLTVPHAEERDPNASATATNAKYLPEVEAVCTRLADEVAGALDDGGLPLVLGGDHSIAIGTLAGASRESDIGAVWFDAHSDVNTPETTPSGNVHGMPLAAALGMGEFADTPWANSPNLSEKNVALVGLRSVDDPERERIRDSDMTAYTMSDIDERGVVDVTEEALAIATDGVGGMHVSLDMDWLDPSHAPGVGTPVRGGVTYREAHSAMELVAGHDDALRSLEVVEVNPILDSHNETAELATELAASALGKRVL
ncbi:arginase [Halococcus sp. AFM35]|uniref:arginase n=1 Tax=Halococcus sp. AFM35 TaxID=3421653 RepID=UPI003EBD7EA2